MKTEISKKVGIYMNGIRENSKKEEYLRIFMKMGD